MPKITMKEMPSMIFKFEENKQDIKLHKSWQAFGRLLDNWDRSDILSKKGYRALLLDDNDSLIGRVSISDVSRLGRIQLTSIKDIALKKNAKSIILGENDMDPDIIPTKNERLEALEIKKISDELNIPIKDHIILARDAYYSYADNGVIYPKLK